MPRLFPVLVLGTVLLVAGCLTPREAGPAPEKIVAVTKIQTSSFCGGNFSSGLAWIETEKDLAITPKNGEKAFSVRGPRKLDVDFTRFAVLRIAMGTRPTGGFEIELAETEAGIQDGTLFVRIRWVEPAADAMVAQMVTSPCLLVRIPRGDYRRIAVVDQNGAVRFRLDLP